MTTNNDKPRSISAPVGVVIRKSPGVTRWAKWVWKVVDLLPGAGPADWRLLRQEGDVSEFHMGTRILTLFHTDAEAYRVSLAMNPPSLFVVLRQTESKPHDLSLHLVTASAYEAQDYLDSGEEIVEAVPMPEGLEAWVRKFADSNFVDEPFVKRKRDKKRIDETQDGVGDARIRQTADVYRTPSAAKPAKKVIH